MAHSIPPPLKIDTASSIDHAAIKMPIPRNFDSLLLIEMDLG